MWGKNLPPLLPHPLCDGYSISRPSAWPRGHSTVAHPRSVVVAGGGWGLVKMMPACHHKTRYGWTWWQQEDLGYSSPWSC